MWKKNGKGRHMYLCMCMFVRACVRYVLLHFHCVEEAKFYVGVFLDMDRQSQLQSYYNRCHKVCVCACVSVCMRACTLVPLH